MWTIYLPGEIFYSFQDFFQILNFAYDFSFYSIEFYFNSNHFLIIFSNFEAAI